MPRMTKAEKLVKAEVDRCFLAHSAGNTISVFDIGKVTGAGVEAAKAGTSIEEAIVAAFAKYRQG